MFVARLEQLPSRDRFVMLWRRQDAWGSVGPFGAVLLLNDALAFIDDEPAFWIRMLCPLITTVRLSQPRIIVKTASYLA